MTLAEEIARLSAAGEHDAAVEAAYAGVARLVAVRQWLTLDRELAAWPVADADPAVLLALLNATRAGCVRDRLPSRAAFFGRVRAALNGEADALLRGLE